MGYVTIREVARQAGVSTTTVSQVLHDKGRFSPETKKQVCQAAKDLGYIPDLRAQAMRSSKTKMIGLLVPDLRNPYFADLVSSMEAMLYEMGVGALIGSSDEQLDRQDDFIMRILGQRIDGVIAVPQGTVSQGLQTIIERELPLIFVDRRVPGMDTVPYVVSDPRPGLRQALETLKGYGHRKVAYVAHPSLGSFSLDERAEAFSSLAPDYFESDGIRVFSCDESLQSHKDVLGSLQSFGATAVIFGYSPDAISCISLLRGYNVQIGHDCSLISFDDIEVFRLITPQISIISQQVEQIGRKGVKMLLDTIETGQKGQTDPVSIATVFEQRGSVSKCME